jgi:para-aminobenzoate synthetase
VTAYPFDAVSPLLVPAHTDARSAARAVVSLTAVTRSAGRQIIEEVESSAPGAYAGAFGWVSADGRADLGVVIRSLTTCGDGRYLLGTGGGITVHSDVAEEYAESRWKAERLLRVFDGPTAESARPARAPSTPTP